MKLKKAPTLKKETTQVILCTENQDFKKLGLFEDEIVYIKKQIKLKNNEIEVNRNLYHIYIIIATGREDAKKLEQIRLSANKITKSIISHQYNSVLINDLIKTKKKLIALIESIILSSYKFDKYFTTKSTEKKPELEKLEIYTEILMQPDLDEIANICKGVFIARDLVNEPHSYLNATVLAEEIKKFGKEAGFKVESFEKSKIEAMKMGGLIAVNKGSEQPPTFSILEWTPKNPVNKKPFIFVGKGIVFDTGGVSLKPTAGSMDAMKSDMAGAAAVIGLLYSIAKNNLPYHVIGLVPATDNRPGKDAYLPQDIIKMHNGMTVEVLNTDAEGRMILADALSFAKQYKPELVIDLATLTGAATVAVGPFAIAAMGNAKKSVVNKLEESGNNTYERIVELPLWEEYGEMIKSKFADIKNVGGRGAGAITAGKFLEHFTDYPWIHLDIAGPAYLDNTDAYRPQGGTGVGVRLLYNFLKNK